MPLGIVLLLLDITLIYHASKTGRLQPWAFIILMVPGIGGLAYIVVELVPEWVSGPSARQARRRMTYKLDPEKVYRELADHLAVSDTVANRAALADECMEIGRYEEAEQHYHHILTLPIGGEPVFALGKARAQFARKRAADAIATLDDLQRRWPDFQSPEAHLLYARALGEAGRLEEALDEYHSVAAYYPGAEEGAVRLAACDDGPHQRGKGGLHRAPGADEARAEACPPGAGRMVVDGRKRAVGMTPAVSGYRLTHPLLA